MLHFTRAIDSYAYNFDQGIQFGVEARYRQSVFLSHFLPQIRITPHRLQIQVTPLNMDLTPSTMALPSRKKVLKRKLTWGCELEHIVLWKWSEPREMKNKKKAVLQDNGTFLVPVEIKATTPAVRGISRVMEAASTLVLRAYREELLKAKINIHTIGWKYDPKMPSLEPTSHSRNSEKRLYHRWSIKRDLSVTPTPDEFTMEGKPYFDLDVELISPTFKCGNRKDDEELTRVLKHIHKRVIYLLPQAAGLHIHIGQGTMNFSREEIQNIGVALWMIDPIFNPLHPKRRWKYDYYAPRNRFHSNLANGMTAEQANREWAQADPQRKSPPGTQLPVGEGRKLELMEGVFRLWRTDATGAVAQLMRTAARGTYNFRNYLIKNGADRPTIEFRQGAGSLNPRWILLWKRIVAATVEWALTAEDDEMLDCAMKCVVSEEMDGYDIYHFLGDFLRFPDEEYHDAVWYLRSTTPDQRSAPACTGNQVVMRLSDVDIVSQVSCNMLPMVVDFVVPGSDDSV